MKEAQEGDLVKPGRILIAQGGKHLLVEKKPLGVIAHISDAPPQSGHRPSADVLFASVAEQFQNHALGIIMTGMGKDGAASLTRLYQEGSRTIGQDEASAILEMLTSRVGYASSSSLLILTLTVSLEIVSSLSFCIFINSRDREGRGTARYSAIASRFSLSVILG